MKKALLLVLIFLASCQMKPSGSDTEFLRASRAAWDAFKFEEQCPHICWLGINPGATTTDEAENILKASNQIDPEWYHIPDSRLYTDWYPGRSKKFSPSVDIAFRDGIVKSLNILNVPLTIDDFIKQLGEPDQIRISVQRAPDAEYIQYAIYFSPRQVMIGVISANWSGPEPTDAVYDLRLNIEFIDTFESASIQPWLGYGHIKDYLPGEIPMYAP